MRPCAHIISGHPLFLNLYSQVIIYGREREKEEEEKKNRHQKFLDKAQTNSLLPAL